MIPSKIQSFLKHGRQTELNNIIRRETNTRS